MHWYNLTKDIVIPLLAPLGAAAAVIVAFLNEQRQKRRAAACILYRDLDWLWQQYRLVAGTQGVVSNEQSAVINEAWMRVFSRLSEDTAAMSAFYGRYLRNVEGQPFLLLANARQRVEEAKTNPKKLLDIEVLFALHNFLMLCEPDHQKLAEHRAALNEHLKMKPALKSLLVKHHAG